MKISVAMAVYNGEKYIKKQIETILQQTIQVDEIIVSDDGSKDSTIDIIRAINDSRIKILTGNKNHGYCGNFEYALNNTSGEVIFLADQDDIWMPNKVETCIRIFEQQKNAELIISNGVLVDANEKTILGEFNPMLKFSGSGLLPRETFLQKSIFGCLAVGMSMCMKKSFKEYVLPFPKAKIANISRLGHDSWIAFCAMKRGSAYYTTEQLVKYRIHGDNTSIWQKNISFRAKFKKLLQSAYSTPYDGLALTEAMLKKLDESIDADVQTIKNIKALMYPNVQQIEAFGKNRLSGTIQLIKLYSKNEIYKKNGVKFFIGQLYLCFLGRRYLKEFAKEYKV